MQIFSFSPFGYEGALVAVEVDLRRGIPAVDVVGLADGAVKESRERMRSAIRNSGFPFPPERVLISLSPADLKKEGAGFDLALALAVLSANDRKTAAGSEHADPADAVLVMGELELSGALRPVKGVNAAATTAAQAGITRCVVSAANGAEAREVRGMKVFAAANLAEAYAALSRPELFTSGEPVGQSFVPPGAVDVDGVLFPALRADGDMRDVAGQRRLVRALHVAAAGGHNVLAFGPPGCGKTLAMQRFPSLLPLLTVEEAQSVTRVHSVAGLLSPQQPLIRERPFRQPHQTASIEGMCGGGAYCRPGEISLAHHGVLFLDEAAEFKTSVLQMLRVPLESGSVSLSRAGRTTVYPAHFQLLLATNPCPCGNYGVSGKLCLCSGKAVEQYWRRFSGPLLDRVDIRVPVAVPDERSADASFRCSSESLRVEIARAVAVQRRRQGKRNAYLIPQEVMQWCRLDTAGQSFLDTAAANNDFSPRAVSSCLKLARTIADMSGSERIAVAHLKEAIDLRRNDGPFAFFGGDV
ncbi:MAG: YifB family Mg chelatase-like AAA ATPase [Treponemataceae bacterium]|nr:YifB family Mg chelatase-like AAA ATPase [Treponemataceae bacterium]